jgi:hypothetical protein
MEITKETILKMSTEARIETETFFVDTMDNLIKKLEEIKKSGEFLEESVKEAINENINHTVKSREKSAAHLQLMEFMNEILCKDNKENAA